MDDLANCMSNDVCTDDIKKRLKQREDMFLRRLFGMLAKIELSQTAVSFMV